MAKTVIDFHGMTTNAAEEIVLAIIHAVRANKRSVEHTFITGRGYIQNKLLDILEEHNLEPVIPWHNNGEIFVVIE